MRFALVNGEKQEADPGLKGECAYCGAKMIPKCGEILINHWAHASRTDCDSWWENETEWHRNWKSHFPNEFQEVVFTDFDTKERHIADIYTTNGMVIELQNSPIKESEIISRELYYGKMMWIINGFPWAEYFNKNIKRAQLGQDGPYRLLWSGRSNMIKRWPLSTTPVFIDFGKDKLWRIKELRSWGGSSLCMLILQPVLKVSLIKKNGGNLQSNNSVRDFPSTRRD